VNIDIDVAQDLAEDRVNRVSERVDAFLRHDFDDHDRERAEAKQYGPPAPEPVADWTEPVARHEIDGWHALWRGSYTLAEREFVRWNEACAQYDLPEMSAFARWCAAKAAFSAGEQGDPAAAQRAQSLLEEAIGHGGRFTTWFNGLRHSLHAMRNEAVPAAAVADGAREQILRAFNAHLTTRGNAANALQRFRRRVDEDVASRSHNRYQQALEHVGELLGYQAVRPRFGQATTDVRWTGVFAGYRGLLTFELKIEHEQHNAIAPRDVDQALGQVNSAQAEWGPRGFAPRGAIVTVLEDIDRGAAAPRVAGGDPPRRRGRPLGARRQPSHVVRWAWSPDDVDARRAAREAVAAKLPDTGWLPRALDRADPFVDPDDLLAEWSA
jgi:hypothetical protein